MMHHHGMGHTFRAHSCRTKRISPLEPRNFMAEIGLDAANWTDSAPRTCLMNPDCTLTIGFVFPQTQCLASAPSS
jgi:hypothetical protein